ncbi:hypothetical protein ACTXT7_001369 [Hymenolepis weldensis]
MVLAMQFLLNRLPEDVTRPLLLNVKDNFMPMMDIVYHFFQSTQLLPRLNSISFRVNGATPTN